MTTKKTYKGVEYLIPHDTFEKFAESGVARYTLQACQGEKEGRIKYGKQGLSAIRSESRSAIGHGRLLDNQLLDTDDYWTAN